MMYLPTFKKIVGLLPDESVVTVNFRIPYENKNPKFVEIMKKYFDFEARPYMRNTETQASYKMKNSELLEFVEKLDKEKWDYKKEEYGSISFVKAEWRVENNDKGGNGTVRLNPHNVEIIWINHHSDDIPQPISDILKIVAPRSVFEATIKLV